MTAPRPAIVPSIFPHQVIADAARAYVAARRGYTAMYDRTTSREALNAAWAELCERVDESARVGAETE